MQKIFARVARTTRVTQLVRVLVLCAISRGFDPRREYVLSFCSFCRSPDVVGRPQGFLAIWQVQRRAGSLTPRRGRVDAASGLGGILVLCRGPRPARVSGAYLSQEPASGPQARLVRGAPSAQRRRAEECANYKLP